MEKIKAEGYDPGAGPFNPKTGTGQNTQGPEKTGCHRQMVKLLRQWDEPLECLLKDTKTICQTRHTWAGLE